MSSKEGLTRFYRDFQRICKQWPVDTSKTGRDFGEHLRTSIDTRFKHGDFEVRHKIKLNSKVVSYLSLDNCLPSLLVSHIRHVN